MNACEKEFDDSFKGITFSESDAVIWVWREAWKKASLHHAEMLEARANEWCKWNDKRIVMELRMIAEQIKGELNESK